MRNSGWPLTPSAMPTLMGLGFNHEVQQGSV
jgi:hypothetical protein